jgi:hypothetical protein
MATYEIEITKRLMKTMTITVPDSVTADEAKEWAQDNDSEIFDVDSYDGTVKWNVNDLVDGEKVEVQVAQTFEDFEYETEGFSSK